MMTIKQMIKSGETTMNTNIALFESKSGMESWAANLLLHLTSKTTTELLLEKNLGRRNTP